MTSEILLDTSTLSEGIKGRKRAFTRQARAYLAAQRLFAFSIPTRYEIRHHGLDLVSENRHHFERIPGLAVTSWRQA